MGLFSGFDLPACRVHSSILSLPWLPMNIIIPAHCPHSCRISPVFRLVQTPYCFWTHNFLDIKNLQPQKSSVPRKQQDTYIFSGPKKLLGPDFFTFNLLCPKNVCNNLNIFLPQNLSRPKLICTKMFLGQKKFCAQFYFVLIFYLT